MKGDVTFHDVTEQCEIPWGCFLLQAGERGEGMTVSCYLQEASCKEPIFQVPVLHQEEEEKNTSSPGTDVDTRFAVR